MLIPTGGSGWVGADHAVARARAAGATEPAPRPRGYGAAFTDPDGHLWTVTAGTAAT